MKIISTDEKNFIVKNGGGGFIRSTLGKSKKKTHYVVECREVKNLLDTYWTKVVKVVYDSRWDKNKNKNLKDGNKIG